MEPLATFTPETYREAVLQHISFSGYQDLPEDTFNTLLADIISEHYSEPLNPKRASQILHHQLEDQGFHELP